MLAFGPASPGSAADDCQCIQVTVLGQDGKAVGSTTVDADEIAGWTTQPGTSYTAPAGHDIEVPAAVPVRDLIDDLAPEFDGLGVSAVTYVRIESSNGGEDRLESAQLGDNGPYFTGMLPVFYLAGDGVAYIRPTAGTEEPQYDALFQSSAGRSLALTVHTSGTVLSTTIAADRTSVKAGDKVTFTAQVEQTGTPLSYDWHLGVGDVTTATPSTTYVWTDPGVYHVALDVRGADSSTGRSNAIKVTVQDPTTTPTPTPSATPTPTPTGEPGGDGDESAAPTGPNTGGGLQPSTMPDPPATPAAPSPSASPSSSPAAPAQTEPGELTGILLTGAEVPTEPGAQATAPARRAMTDDGPLRLPWWVGLGAGLAALLGLGALSESRWLHRRLGRGPDMMRP